MGIRSAITLAAFVALILLSAMFLPATLAVLAVIGLVIAFVLVDAMGNRVLFKMSVRNVIRRPSTTALVLGGLMVGTAIISASLIVGDTLDNMIVGQAAKGYGDIDFVVSGAGEQNTTAGLYTYHAVAPVQSDIRHLEHVDGAEWMMRASASMRSVGSHLSVPTVAVLGMTDAFVHDFGGFIAMNGTALRSLPPAGSAYVDAKLAERLEITDGGEIELFNGPRSITLIVIQVQDERLGAMNPEVYLSLPSVQELTGEAGKVNALAISLDPSGRQEVETSRNAVNTTLAGYPDLQLSITGDRDKAITNAREDVTMFISLFFVFGSFSIIAGIALIINIFTMLGEERKGEMGVARAIGMKRGHLRRLFTYEGMFYAAIAAAIGTVAGLVLAFVLIKAAAAIIDLGDIPLDRYFTFTPFALAVAYLAGFLLTMLTIYFVTVRISDMNIVRAIRNIPEPGRGRDDRKLLAVGLILLSIGALVMVLGVVEESLIMAMSGLSSMTLSAGLLLRKFTGDRIAWSVAGLVTLVVWLPKGFEIFPYDSNIEMFVSAGVFMVVSALVVVMFNSNAIVFLFTKLLRFGGGYKAVLMTAISYPLRAKVRTALSIFIFGLVIFTVATLSMMSGMLGAGIPKIISETSGGFDIVAFSGEPVDMWGEINTTSGLVEKANVTTMVQLSAGFAQVNMERTDPTTGQEKPAQFYYNVVGIGPDLYTVGNYPLKDWNRSLYSTEADVWKAAQENGSLVIIDGTAGSASGTYGISFGSGRFAGTEVGDSFVLRDMLGQNTTVTVIGIMKQSAFNGVFMQREYVRDNLGIIGTNLFLIKLVGDADADRQATLIQNQFVAQQVSTIAMKTMAQQVVGQIDGIFNLIKAFLALGLIIGITGLGIITIRSIHERRIEIGMMRAIGYTKRMVVVSFALESAFVSVLGIVIGSALGVIVGYQLWDTGFRAMGMDFVIAWWPIITVGALALLATLLSVYPASRSASKVSPAEVLRFE